MRLQALALFVTLCKRRHRSKKRLLWNVGARVP
jgi:hypothetical protein